MNRAWSGFSKTNAPTLYPRYSDSRKCFDPVGGVHLWDPPEVRMASSSKRLDGRNG